MWSLSTQAALVAVVVGMATAVALLLRSRATLFVRFSALAGSIAAYYLSALLAVVFSQPQVPAILDALRIVFGSFVVLSTDAFFDVLLGAAGIEARRRRKVTTWIAVAMAIIGCTPLSQELWLKAMSAFLAIVLIGYRLQAVLAHANEVRSEAERARLRYLGFGGCIAIVGFLFDLASMADTPVPALGGVVVAVYLYFISQSLLMSRLLDLHELLGKATIFVVLSVLLSLLYGVLLVWMGENRDLFLFNTLLASSVVLILFEPLKLYLDERTTKLFFRERSNFALRIKTLGRRLTTVIELPQAISQALDNLYESKRATHVSMYMLDADGATFSLQGSRGPTPIAVIDGKSHPSFLRYVLKLQSPVLRDSVERRLQNGPSTSPVMPISADMEGEISIGSTHPNSSNINMTLEGAALLRVLDDTCASLLIPLRGSESVVGLLCLNDDRLSEAYASDEIAALMDLSDQLAVNIENSRLFGVLRERDRLAMVGEMSAGLAHEIRNPLAAIKGAAQELDPNRIGGDDGELLQIIIDEVDRLNGVVTSFLNYARPFREALGILMLNDVVRRTIALLRRDLAETVQIDVDLMEPMPDTVGDPERIQQVLINLLLNAADAMDRRGKITVSTHMLWRDDKAAGVLELRVKDDGPGMSPEVMRRIFMPFFTTKAHGTGLGLPMCQRIVQHHGGSVEVQSVVGAGATFIVRLPWRAQTTGTTPVPSSTPYPSPTPSSVPRGMNVNPLASSSSAGPSSR